MSSTQKNILLSVLVLVIVFLAVYDVQSPPSEDKPPKSSSDTSGETVSEDSDNTLPVSSSDTSSGGSTTGDTTEGQIPVEPADENADGEGTTTQESDDGQRTEASSSESEKTGEETAGETDPSDDTGSSDQTDTTSETNESTDGTGSNEDLDSEETESQETASDSEQEKDEPRTYTVQAGDDVMSIAEQFYGTKSQWDRIWRANSDQLSGRDDVGEGMTLVIPETGTQRAEGTDQTGQTETDNVQPEEPSEEQPATQQTQGSSQPNTTDEQPTDSTGTSAGATEEADTAEQETAGNPPFEAKPGQKWYRVENGDSLWRISKKQYGSGKYFTRIWDLNKDRLDSYNDIRPGDWILLPENPD